MGANFPILLAEDDENDVLLIQRTFNKVGVRHPLFVVTNGDEAINYLQGTGCYSDRQRYPIPELIFLDIKMPRTNGLEVLKWIRNSESAIKRIPVVMTSSSQLQTDIDRAYDLGCNAYFVKPVLPEELGRLFKNTAEYFAIAARPHAH